MSEDPSRPYWEAASRGVLVLQRCDRCGRIRHYPRVLCDACYSFDVSPVEASHEGEVLSWTVTHHPFATDLPSEPPYALVTVDMKAGVRILGLLRDAEALRSGLPVRLTFERAADGRPLPVFVAAN